MEEITLRRIADGKTIRRPLQNWKNLPRAQREKYEVVGEEITSPVMKSTTAAIPEEVKLLRAKKEAKEE